MLGWATLPLLCLNGMRVAGRAMHWRQLSGRQVSGYCCKWLIYLYFMSIYILPVCAPHEYLVHGYRQRYWIPTLSHREQWAACSGYREPNCVPWKSGVHAQLLIRFSSPEISAFWYVCLVFSLTLHIENFLPTEQPFSDWKNEVWWDISAGFKITHSVWRRILLASFRVEYWDLPWA